MHTLSCLAHAKAELRNRVHVSVQSAQLYIPVDPCGAGGCIALANSCWFPRSNVASVKVVVRWQAPSVFDSGAAPGSVCRSFKLPTAPVDPIQSDALLSHPMRFCRSWRASWPFFSGWIKTTRAPTNVDKDGCIGRAGSSIVDFDGVRWIRNRCAVWIHNCNLVAAICRPRGYTSSGIDCNVRTMSRRRCGKRGWRNCRD